MRERVRERDIRQGIVKKESHLTQQSCRPRCPSTSSIFSQQASNNARHSLPDNPGVEHVLRTRIPREIRGDGSGSGTLRLHSRPRSRMRWWRRYRAGGRPFERLSYDFFLFQFWDWQPWNYFSDDHRFRFVSLLLLLLLLLPVAVVVVSFILTMLFCLSFLSTELWTKGCPDNSPAPNPFLIVLFWVVRQCEPRRWK